MKKITVLSVVAILLLFSQCKKKNVLTVENNDDGVYITLNAGYNGKTSFIPNTCEFVWSNGATEYIYVGGSSHYNCMGKLSGVGTGTSSMMFTGTLTITPNEGEKLYFFYLGKGSEKTGSELTTLDFSTQSGLLNDVTDFHIAIGESVYSSGITNYSTTLEMKMSIAFFDVSGLYDETVYLHGDDVYSTATVNYKTGKITGTTKGYINLGIADADKFVALIPSTSTATVLKFDSNSHTGEITFNGGIQAGRYYSTVSNEALEVNTTPLPEGVTPGLFSISATQMVRFSKGNLQYQASTNTWRFADNQWNFVGGRDYQTNTRYGNVGYNYNNYISSTYSGWIDLFGWATSGYNHGAVCYQPYGTNSVFADYSAYGQVGYNLYDNNGTADWGYNKISNGGNENDSWRTMKNEEWMYLLNDRVTISGIRNANAIVNDVNGLILLPDDWNESIYELTSVNNTQAIPITNNISSLDWSEIFEQNGAVFLPETGFRLQNKPNEPYYRNYYGYNSQNELWPGRGFYWTSTTTSEQLRSYYIATYYNTGTMTQVNAEGYAVRLVKK